LYCNHLCVTLRVTNAQKEKRQSFVKLPLPLN
jgi:hypothetical protein